MTIEQDHSLIEITADIVSAFVGNNQVRSTELGELIASVHASLSQIGQPKPEEVPAPALVPAVSIKKSVTDDYLICLDDGQKFKSLKRHLSVLGMTPNEYRAKWGLSRDYPMVAPGYAAKRSELAKEMGLGNRRSASAAPAPANDIVATPAPAKRKAAAKSAKPVETVAVTADAAPKRRGRPKKAA